MRVADCGYYEARRDGNTCRIVECLNKIIAVRCASQILSLPLNSGTNKSSQNPLPAPKPAPASRRYIFWIVILSVLPIYIRQADTNFYYRLL